MKHEDEKDLSLPVLLLASILVVVIVGQLLSAAVMDLKSTLAAAALTNVATVGGLVSGLSLSGTAVLTLSGRYRDSVAKPFGRVIRFILFGGFATLVLIALLCGMSVAWIEQDWTRYVLGFAPPMIATLLIATARLVSSAFAWEDSTGKAPKSKPNPYKPTPK